jgi:hypothetical protein
MFAQFRPQNDGPLNYRLGNAYGKRHAARHNTDLGADGDV